VLIQLDYALLISFGTIAAALFATELTDKDAILLIALATRRRAVEVFAAGAIAFLFTTGVIVAFGSLLVTVVPVPWIRLAGGGVMVAYGLLAVRRIVSGSNERESGELEGGDARWTGLLGMVAALALLDLAGDATEVLTIVFVAHYADPVLVFSAAFAGLVAATALETALGNRLGHLLTPARLRYLSAALFLALGASIILLSLA
jgi:putative Ca2+/H+ antiporter (TMEM165/GDT1 family)